MRLCHCEHTGENNTGFSRIQFKGHQNVSSEWSKAPFTQAPRLSEIHLLNGHISLRIPAEEADDRSVSSIGQLDGNKSPVQCHSIGLFLADRIQWRRFCWHLPLHKRDWRMRSDPPEKLTGGPHRTARVKGAIRCSAPVWKQEYYRPKKKSGLEDKMYTFYSLRESYCTSLPNSWNPPGP